MSFTTADATSAALAAGFTPAEAPIMAAIAIAESAGNASAVSRPNTNGTTDFGAWQINSSHAAVLNSGDRFSLADNARMARQVYVAQGFKAWSTYNNGAYKQHLSGNGSNNGNGGILGTVGTVVGQAMGAVTAGTKTAVGNALGLDGLTNVLSKIGSDLVSTFLALTLFTVGALILARNTGAVQATKHAAVGAAKVAVLA
jgi:hypothetical protein